MSNSYYGDFGQRPPPDPEPDPALVGYPPPAVEAWYSPIPGYTRTPVYPGTLADPASSGWPVAVGPAAPGELGAGTGLAGMRERAVLLGGRLSAGPDGAGNWRVRAELPVES